MDTNSKLSNNSAVILVRHGSTLPYAEDVFTEIKEKFINKSGLAAEIGYMKVSKPTIAGAVEILKEIGINLTTEKPFNDAFKFIKQMLNEGFYIFFFFCFKYKAIEFFCIIKIK